MNDRYIKIFCLILIGLFAVHLAACSTAGSFHTTTPSIAFNLTSSKAKETLSPSGTQILRITPIVTATPFYLQSNTEGEITRIVEDLYTVDSNCKSDLLHVTQPELSVYYSGIEFIDSTVTPNEEIYWIDEIADNYAKDLRAFVACDPAFCQPKLYVQNIIIGTVQEINWTVWNPGRPISRIIWIGDNTLAFFHLTNPNSAEIGIVDIRKEKFLSLWLADYPCK
jgi:hypothetical protein